MIVSIYSVIWGYALFSVAIAAGSILLKKDEAELRVAGLVILVLGFVRILLPWEILLEGRTWEIWNIYPELLDMARTEMDWPGIILGQILLLIWALGSIGSLLILIGKFYKQRIAIKKMEPLSEEDEWKRACWRIAQDLEIRESVEIFYTKAVDNGAQVGFFAPIILISERIKELPKADMEHVLRHECCHYKGKDLWIKLCIKVVCCLLWWNPSVYLLQRAVNQALELRCDRRACTGFGEKEKYFYTLTLHKILTLSDRKDSHLVAGYGGNNHAACVKQRYRCILGGREGKRGGLWRFAVIMAGLAVFLLSYTKIPVPCSHPSEEILKEEGNAYVIEDEVMEDFILRRTSGKLEYYRNGELIKILTEEEDAEEYGELPHYDATQ